MLQVAFAASELAHPFPRGITRTARAMAEQVASLPNISSWCITAVEENSCNLQFVAEPLANWLSSNPIKSATTRQVRLEHLAVRLCPPILAPWIGRCYRGALQACGWMFRPASRVAQVVRADKSNSPRAPAGNVMGARQLDRIFLFEPFNELYDLDLSSSAKVVGFVHDLIPLRLQVPFLTPQRFAGRIRRVLDASRWLPCNSRFTQQDLREAYPDTDRRSFVVPLGHHAETFHSADPTFARQFLLRKAGLPEEMPYFVVLGAVEHRKNIEGMLRAAIEMAKQNPEAKFAVEIVGEDLLASRFNEVTREARHWFPVQFTGYLSDEAVASLLKGSVALLFASFMEGFGLPILEAFSASTLVITSNVSALPEVGGPHALYCDPYSIDDIAAQMIRALTMPAEERASRTAAAAQYAAQFTWEAAARRLLAGTGLPLDDRQEIGSSASKESAVLA